MKYRIGIDVGDRSVGLAAIEFDDAGIPIERLALVTYRHDGGLDPTTNKNPQSRKATAGVARRTRRMRRQRRRRLKNLDMVLIQLGYKVPQAEEPQTYEAWFARGILSSNIVEDTKLRDEYVVRAVRHMARHRGWRNPWWRFHQLQQAPVPSKSMGNILESAKTYWPDLIDESTTVGELGALASRNNILLRPRTYDVKKKPQRLNNQGIEPVLSDKVRQEDLYFELCRYWEVQDIPQDHFEPIARALFEQNRPYVPSENVGRDPLPGQRKLNRASRSSLEFIEYRIVQAVANLRVREGREKRLLSDLEFDTAVSYLLGFNEEKSPTWGDVAEAISVEANRLVAPVIDDVKLNVAPYDKSSHLLLKKVKKNSEVRRWWDTADQEQRAELIRFLSDTTKETLEEADSSGLSDVFESWPESEREILEGLDFESGRAAYSTDSLRRLSSYMREHHCDVYVARQSVFGVSNDWEPPREGLDVATGQPAVDRVLAIVRKFVLACERKWGIPDSIVIEHVRTGLMGPAARHELLREIQKNRDINERMRTELRDGGISNPTRADVRRYRVVQNQDCRCLYCGCTITVDTSELDHIVPRAGGGSSRIDNLVAVCRTCNSQKGKIPFAVWASSSTREGVSVEEAVERLWSFDKVGVFKGVSGKRLKQQITRRLRQTEEDEPIDERSLASTAYAAVALRQRLETHFSTFDQKFIVDVYSGSMTRESRRAGGIDEQLLLRGQRDKNRFDVRHHAVDAAVLTLLNRSVARTLEQRRLMKEERDLESRDNSWRDFEGLGATAQSKFREWKVTCQALADVLSEAVASDCIPVITPLRLTPKNGAVHKDTIAALIKRSVGDLWPADVIERVQDPEIYLALKGILGKAKELEADAERTLVLPDGRELTASAEVLVFPEKAASIVVGTGAAKIGDSLHHARLYTWRDKKGKLNVGMLRVFGAELPWLMKTAGTKDALTVPIHPGSQSYRGLQSTVQKVIEAGTAQEIGWVTYDDEIELDVETIMRGTSEVADFMRILPETRWKLDRLQESHRVGLRPLLLSREEIPTQVYEKELTLEELEIVAKTLKTGARISVNELFSSSGTKVIRRDALGNPRWHSNGALPVSLDLSRIAAEKLGE